MHEPRSTLRLAFEALLRARDLERPDGNALYAYGFSREEFAVMGEVLRAAGRRFLGDPHGRALFVAYAAEWFRRVREGGHWDWIHPLQSLNVRYQHNDPRAQVHYGEVRAAAEGGLSAWRRRPKPGLSILHAVIAESGFPAASVRRGPRLTAWLKRSVLAIEAGFTAEEAVAAEAWRAPESLVQTLFEAAVLLCRSIADLRASVPDDVAGLDPVAHLDRTRSGWRESLPFAVEEQDVRKLVESLVRAQREEACGLDVVRRLRLVEGRGKFFAELSLYGAIDHRRLPEALRSVLADASRVRLKPAGPLAERSRVVAALERVTEEEKDRWEVRPLLQGCDFRLELDEEFRLQAIAGEAVLAEFVAFGGDPMEGPVVALEPARDAEFGEATEFRVLGPSPARTTSPWLALAVEPRVAEQLRVDGVQRRLEGVLSCGRVLVAFDGTAELVIGGDRFVWRTRDEKREALRLSLVGDIVRRCEGRVFCGCPSAWLVDEETLAPVPHHNLIWRAIGSKDWVAVSQREPRGRVELAFRRKEHLVAWARAEIVPSSLTLKADAKARRLTVSGLAGGRVAAMGNQPLPCRYEADGVAIDLTHHPRGAMLRLSLEWANRVELLLPDPVTEPVLLDPDGHPCVSPRLSVGRLGGYRLLAPSPWTLIFELRRKGHGSVYAVRTVDGLTPLTVFGGVIRQLLGGCQELDACVRLTWAGREERLTDVGWYDLDQNLTLQETDSPFAAIATMAGAPTLMAFSLADPRAGAVATTLASKAASRVQLAEVLGEGPWLLTGSVQDGRRLRPKVLDSAVRGVSSHPFQAEMRQATLGRRDEAFDARLADPTKLSTDELRYLVELARTAAKAEVPYASVDALRALARAPQAAVYVLAECGSFAERELILRLQNELPLLWCVSAIEDWFGAFVARRSRLVNKLAEIGEASDLVDSQIARALSEIVDMQPGTRVHARGAMLISGAQAGADAGVLDRLCRPLAMDLGELTQQLAKRHGDAADPPRALGLTSTVPQAVGHWGRYDRRFADVVAAPLVAAGMAMNEIDRSAHLAACRTAWLFDRDYFEAAVVSILSDRANSGSQCR